MMGELRGIHVAGIFGAGFAVIIAANTVLAVSAVRTFPGLEVKNSYVASQSFEADRQAQEALGWETRVEISGDILRLEISGTADVPPPTDIHGVLGRPTHGDLDRVLAFRPEGGVLVADVADLLPGIWRLRLLADAPGGVKFRRDLSVRNRP